MGLLRLKEIHPKMIQIKQYFNIWLKMSKILGMTYCESQSSQERGAEHAAIGLNGVQRKLFADADFNLSLFKIDTLNVQSQFEYALRRREHEKNVALDKSAAGLLPTGSGHAHVGSGGIVGSPRCCFRGNGHA